MKPYRLQNTTSFEMLKTCMQIKMIVTNFALSKSDLFPAAKFNASVTLLKALDESIAKIKNAISSYFT